MKKTTKKKDEEVVATNEGVKSYNEKVSDYEQHFDDIGLHDPSTDAAIAQQKTAIPRGARVPEGEEAPQLVERAALRESKKAELNGARQLSADDFPSEQKKMNEKLSAELQAEEEADDKLGKKKRVIKAVRDGE